MSTIVCVGVWVFHCSWGLVTVLEDNCHSKTQRTIKTHTQIHTHTHRVDELCRPTNSLYNKRIMANITALCPALWAGVLPSLRLLSVRDPHTKRNTTTASLSSGRFTVCAHLFSTWSQNPSVETPQLLLFFKWHLYQKVKGVMLLGWQMSELEGCWICLQRGYKDTHPHTHARVLSCPVSLVGTAGCLIDWLD